MTAADPDRILAALPDALWPALLQAVRTATDRLGRSQLPAALQPYAGFTPAKLGRGRAKAAVSAALVGDARLREAVGTAIGAGVWDRAKSASPTELVERFGHAKAAAALVARARWDDLEQVAADLPEEQPPPPAQSRVVDQRPEAGALRKERDTAQRRAAAAQKRADDMSAEMGTLRRRVEELEVERDAALKQAAEERTRSRDRLARLQRRVSEAEARARAEATRFTEVAAELEHLAATLRGEPAAPVAEKPPARTASAPVIPRRVRAATPGRPSVLPAGVVDGQPAAVESLLAIPGVEVVLDGYNVTKDMRGVPTAALNDQRAWLLQLAAAVAAGRDLKMSVVFDGAGDRMSASSVARIVRCVFTADDETAHERIVSMVRALDSDRPVVVVTSDLEVRGACEELGANVIASGAFLAAVA